MTSKTNVIIVSLLLVTASLIIPALLKGSSTGLDIELADFLSGILFGSGIVIFASIFVKRRLR